MNALKTFVLAGVSVFGILLTSCQHEPELIPGTREVCFQENVLPIVQDNCATSGCHDGNGHQKAMNTYESILNMVQPGKPMASKFHQVITSNPSYGNFMPPSPKTALSKESIDFISLWILQGAKAPDTSNVTYSGPIQPIFDKYCIKCHNPNLMDGGLIFTDYASDTTAIGYGRVLVDMEQSDTLAYPDPMPKGSDKICNCYIDQIKHWVNLGMPNN